MGLSMLPCIERYQDPGAGPSSYCDAVNLIIVIAAAMASDELIWIVLITIADR